MIRERLRGSFDKRIRGLEEIAETKSEATADRIRAIDLLPKYGLCTTKEITVEHIRDRLSATVALIRAKACGVIRCGVPRVEAMRLAAGHNPAVVLGADQARALQAALDKVEAG